jgi:hypothetical protein
MHIEMERTGGFAGLSLITTVDTETLPEDEAVVLHDAVAAASFYELPAQIASTAPGADRFHYRLTVEDRGRRHTVRAGESALPATLRPLIDALSAIARRDRGTEPDP